MIVHQSTAIPASSKAAALASAGDPMRVTFVLPYAGLAGGIRVVAIYADRLQKRGHKVVILSSPYRLLGFKEKFDNLIHRILLKVRGEREQSHLNDVAVEHRRLRSPDYIQPHEIPPSDVVVATWWETAENLSKISVGGAARAYFLQHHEVHEGQPVDRVHATWRLPMQKIVVAQWLADLAREDYGDPTAITVPNAVDLQQFAVPPRGKQPHPTVGLMYSNARFKGVDICGRAIHIARAAVPDLVVRSFGMADTPGQRSLIPADTIYTTTPAQSELKNIYAACDAWLFGSRSEGFGLPILEAMAARTPVIATPAGAAPELVSRGGGEIVRPEDPQHMAEAIIRFARMQEAEWKRRSDIAYQTASAYSWDDATDLFESALRKAIERARHDEVAAA